MKEPGSDLTTTNARKTHKNSGTADQRKKKTWGKGKWENNTRVRERENRNKIYSRVRTGTKRKGEAKC